MALNAFFVLFLLHPQRLQYLNNLRFLGCKLILSVSLRPDFFLLFFMGLVGLYLGIS